MMMMMMMMMMMNTTKKTLTGTLVTDDELDETAYTVGTSTDDPEHLGQFDGNLEDAGAFASQVYASASQFSKKHVSFWLVSRVPEAIFFLLVLVLLTAWLSHPLIEKPSKVSW